ncbi:MAG: diaminopimelate epimerase [Chloroflexi bacterium]|nr:MAG: diaminopimelate epimerase [Chloroflexota bacterium]
MHGCGNDFIVIDGPLEITPEGARHICDRRRGIGADGILTIGWQKGGRWLVTLHNADGSLGESCGNGARCVARYLLDRHGGDSVELSFVGGDVSARREGESIAITLRAPSPPEAIRIDGRQAYRTSVGNPHVVVFVPEPDAVDLPALAASARAIAGEANVGAAGIVDGGLVTLRVDERGVGETLACGTGACAAVSAAMCVQPMADTVRVRVRGGDLVVRTGPKTFELSGPAEYAFEGTFP